MKASKENLEKHRAAASRLRKLLGERLLEGSFYSATRNGVTSYRLTDNRAGKCRAMHVPKANAEEVRRWTSNWKEAKALLREISECARECLREQSPRARREGAGGGGERTHRDGTRRKAPTSRRSSDGR